MAFPQDSQPGGLTPIEHPEVVSPGEGPPDGTEAVEQPAKVMRIGSMIKLLLDEVRQSDLDEPSRERLREIYETSVAELSSALSPDLLARPCPSVPAKVLGLRCRTQP